MSRTLNQLYRGRDVIPITPVNAPLWIWRTFQDHRSQAARRPRERVRAPWRSYMRPNLSRPIFAVGAPRSGTTFLGDGLSTLPEIAYFFEPVITKGAVRHVHNGDWSAATARRVYRMAYAWLMRIQCEPQLRFCEKTPGNCFIIPFLHQTFKGARFIHIVRDGRDSAISLAEKDWYSSRSVGTGQRDPDGYRYGPEARFFVEPERRDQYESTNDLHRCIWLWRRYVEAALEGCAQVPPECVLQIQYEKLIGEPSETAERIASFIGIENAASVRSYTATVTRNARSDSLQRWKTTLDDETLEQLEDEAGELLGKLGYTTRYHAS